MKYLICLDLDGTLLNKDSKLSTNTIKFIKEIKDKHTVCIVTGRPLRNSHNFHKELELDTLISNYNGTKITNLNNNEILLESKIPNTSTLDFYKQFESSIKNIFVEIGEDIYIHKEDDFLTLWGTENNTNYKDVLSHDLDFNGVIFLIKTDEVKNVENYFADKDINIRVWSEHDDYSLSELYTKDFNKGTAISFLKDYYKDSFDKVITVGDSHNDLDMFKFADISCAMLNSNDDIKSRATHISKHTNYDDGVVNFLKEILNQ